MRAAAADDQRILCSAQELGGLADRGFVDLGLRARQRLLAAVAGPSLPQTSIAHCSDAGPGRPDAIDCDRLGDQPRRLLGLPDQRGIIHQPLDDAGLVADLVQVPEMPADIGVGNFADQRQHRRIHRIGGEQGGARS